MTVSGNQTPKWRIVDYPLPDGIYLMGQFYDDGRPPMLPGSWENIMTLSLIFFRECGNNGTGVGIASWMPLKLPRDTWGRPRSVR